MIDLGDQSELRAIVADLKMLLEDVSEFIRDDEPFVFELYSELAKEGYNYIGPLSASTLLDKCYKDGRGAMDVMEAMLEDVGRVLSGEE